MQGTLFKQVINWIYESYRLMKIIEIPSTKNKTHSEFKLTYIKKWMFVCQCKKTKEMSFVAVSDVTWPSIPCNHGLKFGTPNSIYRFQISGQKEERLTGI